MSRQKPVHSPVHIPYQPRARWSDVHSLFKVAGATAVAGFLAAGCSADIARFDGQGFGLTDSGSARIPSQGLRRGEASRFGDAVPEGNAAPGGTYYAPQSSVAPAGQVRMSALPEAAAPSTLPPQQSATIRSRPLATPPRPTVPVASQSMPIPPGATIEVVAGDTLYGLAKKHAVPVNELMTLNNLSDPTIRPGQRLVVPATRSIARANTPQKPIIRAASPQVTALSAPVATSPTIAAAPASSDWQGSHTVKPGENLYGIARASGVPLARLQEVNGVSDPTKVKPGTILKVPTPRATASAGGATPATATAINPAPVARVAGAVATAETPRIVQTPTKPVIINATSVPVALDRPVAAVDPTEAPAAEPAVGDGAAPPKFRWPVKGRVIGRYGPRPDSTHNDGINIAVPMGSDVHAAEAGTVAYAGSELRGYGNLVLLRHDNGWVTAYAHNEEILVKHGDKVSRGQPIAKAGKTGTVDQPQVHFEIRQGQKPVDPLPHLEKL